MLRPPIGYVRLPGIPARVLTIIHEGVLGELDDKGAEAVVTTLNEILHRREAEVVSIHMLGEESALWQALHRRNIQALGLDHTRWMIHRTLKLEKEEGFLIRNMRSKHRSWIRRKERELEEAFSGKVHWEWHSRVLDMPALCERMEGVAMTTYQRGLGAGFVDNRETRERLDLFARRGQMRVLLLEIDGLPKAYWLGTVYGKVFHASATGYTTDMTGFEVGTLAFHRMVDELVREGIDLLDFGLGDAYYKERFADSSWREASVQLFARSIKGRFLKGYLGASVWLDDFARRVAKRLGILDRVKQAWRSRLRI
jgi:CelD/BcsL family acetyltransferase involved in cellulose biosynthesis